jgi:hypothetical protein
LHDSYKPEKVVYGSADKANADRDRRRNISSAFQFLFKAFGFIVEMFSRTGIFLMLFFGYRRVPAAAVAPSIGERDILWRGTEVLKRDQSVRAECG